MFFWVLFWGQVKLWQIYWQHICFDLLDWLLDLPDWLLVWVGRNYRASSIWTVSEYHEIALLFQVCRICICQNKCKVLEFLVFFARTCYRKVDMLAWVAFYRIIYKALLLPLPPAYIYIISKLNSLIWKRVIDTLCRQRFLFGLEKRCIH